MWFRRSLESIDLSHNQLFLVPSHLPRALVNLLLVGNNIERIPRMENIYLLSRPEVDLLTFPPPAGFVFAHMHPGLEYLYLSYNNLGEDAIEAESFWGVHASMVELCLDHNQLSAVPPGISEMSGLHFLRLNNNRIRSEEPAKSIGLSPGSDAFQTSEPALTEPLAFPRSVAAGSICDPDLQGDPNLVVLRLENNYIDSRKISPTAFSCAHASSSVILKPQKTK